MHHWLAQYLLIIDIYLYISLTRSRLQLTSAVLCTRYKDTTIDVSCICCECEHVGVSLTQ